MRRAGRLSYLPILAGIVALAVAVPGTASAKGPTDAQVDGPGLAQPIALDWDEDEAALTGLIDATGFWELAEPAATTEPTRRSWRALRDHVLGPRRPGRAGRRSRCTPTRTPSRTR